jgi:glutamate-1-semialdehyde 2,1-aminomutase
MAAGITTLQLLRKEGKAGYERLGKLTGRLTKGLLDIAKECGHNACGGSISGMYGLFFHPGPVNNYDDALKSDKEKFARWHKGMLKRGIYLAPSQFEAGFVSMAHTDADVDATLKAAKEVMKEI